MSPKDSGILTPTELAARWDISTGTLENWRVAKPRLGPVPVKLGPGRNARVVYRIQDVEAYEKKMRRRK